MYRGKRTLFYNGENLWEEGDEEGTIHYLIYDEEERQRWEVIIILPGVEVIDVLTFIDCKNIETVIMSDSVRRIADCTFFGCKRLAFVKLSTNLEYIGYAAFKHCSSIYSIFIPSSCREIGDKAFSGCTKLIILNVPQTTELGEQVIMDTALIDASNFEVDSQVGNSNNAEVNEWIKHVNQEEEFALHRECSSCSPPSDERLYEIIKEQGLSSLYIENKIGITALKYLEENPFFENQIDEKKLIIRYILDLMGEFIA